MSSPLPSETFTPDERAILERHFTNSDQPVFGMRNLPEVVKGALFARYSRSPKSIRRLFLDEFHEAEGEAAAALEVREESEAGKARAEQLYDRIFNQYGDDSVAQLGGAHIACENASNVLTKVLERGRLAAYLEQSTRYIRYDQKVGGRYRYMTPEEIRQSSLDAEYEAVMELLFDTYSRLISDLLPWLESRFPKSECDSPAVWRSTLNAKACDVARGLLPASTVANVGIFATGQSYEMLLMRMFSHPLAEVRDYAAAILAELRTMIPSFMRRVDEENRGRAWSRYFADNRERMRQLAASLPLPSTSASDVTLVDWDPEGENKIVAAALYESSHAPDEELHRVVRTLSEREKDQIFDAYVGERQNRRHKPGRALERTSYRFDVLSDYGAFRDLQRHRMLTIEWQRLTTIHGYTTPEDLQEIGGDHAERWKRAMERADALYRRVATDLGEEVAQYAVPFAYRVRFLMQMNAREAFHLIELRSQRQGHPNYRRIAQEMHRQIAEIAGHRRVARAMRFVDHEEYELERLDAERRAESRAREAAANAATR